MFSDYHMHSEFSNDSRHEMENLIQTAIAKGLEEICFTEHVDYGVKSGSDNCDYDAYFKKFYRLKKKYQDQINLKIGIEFGVQKETIACYQKDAKEHAFDFIILSVHQINNQEFWTQSYQKGKSQKEFHRGYYQELLTIVQNYHDYDVLGHLDLMRRYDKVGFLPFSEVSDLVEEILKSVITAGKGIEVNTSSFRYQVGDLTPAREILELYHELGGKIITIGSDSHKKEHVGAHIREVQAILKDIGFTHHCTYDQRVPIFHQL